jgi:FolB domain-containing protein
MSQLLLNELRVRGRVGCKDSERAHPQMLHMDLRIHYDMSDAIASDDVSKAIDYKGVAACVRELLGSREWHLIETMAQDVCHAVRGLSERITRVQLTVTKDVITDVRSVSVVHEVGE